MLDVTSNQNIIGTGCGMVSSSLDDDMDPPFDNDWLHEHNLDILFDLFEEEVERKGLDVASSNSSAIFGTSPVTSYLFGTSPSLASALDLYDLLYFENQHQQTINASQQSSSSSLPPTTTTNSQTNHQTNRTTAELTNNNNKTTDRSCNMNAHQVSKDVPINHTASSITNAMKIKRRSKKGQSEGVSLLARPLTSNNGSIGQNSGSTRTNNKTNSDKNSTKLTNFKKPLTGSGCSSSVSIDINQTRQGQYNSRNEQHIHRNHHTSCTSGYAVIREHAYAVRGH